MKTKELMIGDWVYGTEKKKYGRVDKLDNYELEDCDIVPIPLTAEILEKNGFLLHNSASYFKEYMWTTGGIDEYADVYIEVGKDQQDNWRWDNLKFKVHFFSGDVSLMKMHYVHELQHALKLCKIDKEIEL